MSICLDQDKFDENITPRYLICFLLSCGSLFPTYSGTDGTDILLFLEKIMIWWDSGPSVYSCCKTSYRQIEYPVEVIKNQKKIVISRYRAINQRT